MSSPAMIWAATNPKAKRSTRFVQRWRVSDREPTDWITERLYDGFGEVRFGLTEHAGVYVLWYDRTYRPHMARGETAGDAVAAAMAGEGYPGMFATRALEAVEALAAYDQSAIRPVMTGCCAECGTTIEVTVSPVNDIEMIRARQCCKCSSALHIWPR
jgi:hypothetical protein